MKLPSKIYYITKSKISKTLTTMLLFIRWYICTARSRRVTGTNILNTEYGLERCEVIYINLLHREDRKKSIENEFTNVNHEHFSRFDAFYAEKGIIGCAKSHLELLKKWIPQNHKLLMICEDDIVFLGDRDYIDQLIEEFYKDNRLDVLCLGNNPSNKVKISKLFNITSSTQTMSCYVIKEHMRVHLIKIFQESLLMLENGVDPRKAAIDKVWKKIQLKYTFAIPRVKTVIQSESFSDIEKKIVNYGV